MSSEDDVLGRILLEDWLVSDSEASASEQVEQEVFEVEGWVFGGFVFSLFFVWYVWEGRMILRVCFWTGRVSVCLEKGGQGGVFYEGFEGI